MKDIHLKDIKKDQVFFERCFNTLLEVTALEDTYESGQTEINGRTFRQWKCKAKTEQGETIDYLTTENHEHYGSKLFVEIPNSARQEWKVSKLRSKHRTGDERAPPEDVFVGELGFEPKVGEELLLVETGGMILRTSKILKIEEKEEDGNKIRIIHTRNSEYRLEKFNPSK